MIRRDLKNNVAVDQSLAPAARTAAANGSTSDLRGFRGATAILSLGLWTNGTFLVSLEESDNDSDWSAVASADLLGAFVTVSDATNDNGNQRVGYIGIKRYLRAVVAQSDSPAPGTGLVLGVEIVKSHPDIQATA